MRITIAKKLWLGFAILILILGISGSVTYFQIEKSNRSLKQFLSVQEPLEEALLEMEISLGKTAISILAFVRDGRPVHIEKLHIYQKKFDAFLKGFNSLATTKPEKAFGQKALVLMKGHQGLIRKIIDLTEKRGRAQKKFIDLADQMNITTDQNLSPGTDEEPSLSLKKGAAMLMKISFHRMFSAVEGYVIQQKPALKNEIKQADSAF